MTRKDIEKAANEEIGLVGGSSALGVTIEKFCRESFIVGAEWRINSVWHDASEQPTIDNADIVIAYNNHIRSEFWCNFADWDKFVKTTKLEYWAYIKDLLPIKEDEKC